MKRKLLYLACFITSFTFAQSIATFNSVNMSNYAIVTGTIDHSPTGASTSWNFTLATSESSTDSYDAPTATQASNFPGTTNVFTNVAGTSGDQNDILLAEAAGVVSLTGAITPDLELNYDADNALIGTFPLSFGYNNTDTVAGTFTAAVSGTFSGNIVKTVDAHGTLSMNDVGAGAYSAAVTRLKIVQTVTLSLPPVLPNAGTATQTSYYYYDNTNGNLVFRSNTVHIVIPFAGVDETNTINESLLTNLLNTADAYATDFSVYPNPVNNILNIQLKTPSTINALVVSDINGRQVIYTTNNTTSLDVSALQVGMYILKIHTDKGMLTKKFIKN